MSLGCDEDCQRCGSLSLHLPTIISLRFLSCCEESEAWRNNFNGKVLSQLSFIQKAFTFGECGLGISWGSFPPVLITWALCFSTREEFSKKICWAALSLSYLPAPTSLSFAHSVCLQIEQILGRFGKVWVMPGQLLTLTSIKRWKPNYQENHQRKGFSFCGNMLRFNPKRAESQFARPKTAMTDTLHTQTFHLYLIFKILFCLSTHLHSQWPSLDLTQHCLQGKLLLIVMFV